MIYFHRNLFFIAALLLAGCSVVPSVPSETNGRSVLEHKIAEQSQGNILLVSFKKLNAVSSGQIYQMEFQAEIQFLKDGSWSKRGMVPEHILFAFSRQRLESGFAGQVMADINGSQNVRQGEHQSIKDTMMFEKSEKGWKAEDGQVY